MKSRKPKINKSGLPEGSTASYVKGQSCGRGKHDLVIAKKQTYAVCTRCHLRLYLVREKMMEEGPDYDPFDYSL